MNVAEIKAAITERTKLPTYSKFTMDGMYIGVPAELADVVNWGLLPIDQESHPRFIDFMVSLAAPKVPHRDPSITCDLLFDPSDEVIERLVKETITEVSCTASVEEVQELLQHKYFFNFNGPKNKKYLDKLKEAYRQIQESRNNLK